MAEFFLDISSKIFEVYKEIDRMRARQAFASGLVCPEGCGLCCEGPDVETTVLEVPPLAEEIYRRQEEEAVLWAIETKLQEGDSVCVLYRPEPEVPGNGGCRYYEFRFLLCRLFGFSARIGKKGELELCRLRRPQGKGARGGVQSGNRHFSRTPRACISRDVHAHRFVESSRGISEASRQSGPQGGA